MRTAIVFMLIILLIALWIFFMGNKDPFVKKQSLLTDSTTDTDAK